MKIMQAYNRLMQAVGLEAGIHYEFEQSIRNVFTNRGMDIYKVM
jgi:hypothetical protein